MMKKLLVILFVALTTSVSAQCKAENDICDNLMTSEYISDGQTYKAMLFGDQVAQFEVTFFEHSTYRIVGVSGSEEGNIVITIFDEQGKELFSNKDYLNAPYWDFVMESTMHVTIEAKLDESKLESGCAALLIGFKK